MMNKKVTCIFGKVFLGLSGQGDQGSGPKSFL
jgi:hypothetical protein